MGVRISFGVIAVFGIIQAICCWVMIADLRNAKLLMSSSFDKAAKAEAEKYEEEQNKKLFMVAVD